MENPKTEPINNIYSIVNRNYNLTPRPPPPLFLSRELSLSANQGTRWTSNSVGLSPGNIHQYQITSSLLLVYIITSMITYCCMRGSENIAGLFNLYHINLLFGAGKS